MRARTVTDPLACGTQVQSRLSWPFTWYRGRSCGKAGIAPANSAPSAGAHGTVPPPSPTTSNRNEAGNRPSCDCQPMYGSTNTLGDDIVTGPTPLPPPGLAPNGSNWPWITGDHRPVGVISVNIHAVDACDVST